MNDELMKHCLKFMDGDDHDYDEDESFFKAFVNWVTRVSDDEFLYVELLPYIQLRYPLQTIIDVLSEDFDVEFSEKDFNDFPSIYMELNNNLHLWANYGTPPSQLAKRGIKSSQLRDSVTAVNVKSPHIIPFPDNDVFNQTNTFNKVGRNDPCPCGSGKKYKKCCGR